MYHIIYSLPIYLCVFKTNQWTICFHILVTYKLIIHYIVNIRLNQLIVEKVQNVSHLWWAAIIYLILLGNFSSKFGYLMIGLLTLSTTYVTHYLPCVGRKNRHNYHVLFVVALTLLGKHEQVISCWELKIFWILN